MEFSLTAYRITEYFRIKVRVLKQRIINHLTNDLHAKHTQDLIEMRNSIVNIEKLFYASRFPNVSLTEAMEMIKDLSNLGIQSFQSDVEDLIKRTVISDFAQSYWDKKLPGVSTGASPRDVAHISTGAYGWEVVSPCIAGSGFIVNVTKQTWYPTLYEAVSEASLELTRSGYTCTNQSTKTLNLKGY